MRFTGCQFCVFFCSEKKNSRFISVLEEKHERTTSSLQLAGSYLFRLHRIKKKVNFVRNPMSQKTSRKPARKSKSRKICAEISFIFFACIHNTYVMTDHFLGLIRSTRSQIFVMLFLDTRWRGILFSMMATDSVTVGLKRERFRSNAIIIGLY